MFARKRRGVVNGLKAVVFTVLASCLLLTTPVHAQKSCVCDVQYTDGSSEVIDGVSVAIFGDENGCYCGGTQGEGIFYILSVLLSILTFGIGAAATLGFIIVGYQYMTARDNAAQVMKAKQRAFHIIIGIACYALFWVIINFLIPGGILDDSGKNIASTTSRLEEKNPPISNTTKPASGTNGSSDLTKVSSKAALVSSPEDVLPYAKQFIVDTNTRYGTNYKVPDATPLQTLLGTPGSDTGFGCWSDTWGCGQCTAVSGWFIEKLTGYTNGSGNGTQMVRNLHTKNPSVNILYAKNGEFPEGMAVYSTIPHTHTGVIIGKTGDEYITLESNIQLKNQLYIGKYNKNYFVGQLAEFFPVDTIDISNVPGAAEVASGQIGGNGTGTDIGASSEYKAGTYTNQKNNLTFNTYYQCDSPWGSKPGNSGKTVCDNACNMIAAAVLSSAKDHTVDPSRLLSDNQKNVMPATSVEKYTDMKCWHTYSKAKEFAVDALHNGSVAEIMINQGQSGQHYMAILDISNDGSQVYVGNGINRNWSGGFTHPGWYNTDNVFKNVYEATICK